tara:strand:+ start:296 stop:430 length:135 start_codon:yes stop_codon:yes gene_type:complete
MVGAVALFLLGRVFSATACLGEQRARAGGAAGEAAWERLLKMLD